MPAGVAVNTPGWKPVNPVLAEIQERAAREARIIMGARVEMNRWYAEALSIPSARAELAQAYALRAQAAA